MMVCSRNMGSLTKFEIILAYKNNETYSVKISKNFVRLAIFPEQTNIIVINALRYNGS